MERTDTNAKRVCLSTGLIVPMMEMGGEIAGQLILDPRLYREKLHGSTTDMQVPERDGRVQLRTWSFPPCS